MSKTRLQAVQSFRQRIAGVHLFCVTETIFSQIPYSFRVTILGTLSEKRRVCTNSVANVSYNVSLVVAKEVCESEYASALECERRNLDSDVILNLSQLARCEDVKLILHAKRTPNCCTGWRCWEDGPKHSLWQNGERTTTTLEIETSEYNCYGRGLPKD